MALPYKASKLAPWHNKSYEFRESQMSRRRKIVRKMLSRRRQLIARRIETRRNIPSNPPNEEYERVSSARLKGEGDE